MNNEVVAEANKGIVDNVKDSVTDFISSSKDSIVNNGVVNKGSEAINESTKIVSTAVSNISIENTKDAIMNAMSDSSSTLYFLIVLLIIAAFVCYIVYYIIVDTVIIQQRILIPGTEMPIICSQHSKYPFTQELDSGNGNKRTYCFWIYIFDIKAADGQYRHVASIYPNKSDTVFHSVKDSTIYIRLDSKKNSLQVRFPTVDDDKTTFEADSGKMPINEFLVNTKGTENKNLVTGVEIEYIPIQRWVHVGIVINDIGGGSFNIFVDGNYTKTENNQTVSSKDNSSNDRNHYTPSSIINVGKLNMNHKGVLHVGGVAPAYGFSGLISKFTIFNYDMNRNDIYKEYSSGPMKGVLASMGLTAYGIRNPIYKIKSSDTLE
jgi:hypothetical protein